MQVIIFSNANFPRAPSLDVPDLSNYSAGSVTIKTGIFWRCSSFLRELATTFSK